MKTNIILPFLTILIFLFISCDDNYDLVEVRDNNGNLIESYFLKNGKKDSIQYFYQNGVKTSGSVYVNGSYTGKKYIYDTLENEIGFVIEHYSKEFNEWIVNEEFFYGNNKEIDTTKSFFSDIQQNNNCLHIYVSNVFGANLVLTKIFFESSNGIKDSIVNNSNPNKNIYCYDKFKKGDIEHIVNAHYIADESAISLHGDLIDPINPILIRKIFKKINIK
jgi:hypothetical protein